MTTDDPQSPEAPKESIETQESHSKAFLKLLIPVVGLLIAIVIALTVIKKMSGTSPRSSQTTDGFEIKVGAIIPDFNLPLFQGAEIAASKLIETQKAKVVLINFWATWCDACVAEMPSLIRLRNQYKEKGLSFVAVNLDENPDQVLPKALKNFAITFPVYHDEDGKLAEIFDVRAIPLTVLMDSERKILFIESGERDWDDVEIHSKMERWLSR